MSNKHLKKNRICESPCTYRRLNGHTDIRNDSNCIIFKHCVTKPFFFIPQYPVKYWISCKNNQLDIRSNPSIYSLLTAGPLYAHKSVGKGGFNFHMTASTNYNTAIIIKYLIHLSSLLRYSMSK